MTAVADELLLDVKQVRRRREALGLTLGQAPIAAGFYSRQQWDNVESGRRVDVPISTLGRLAKALQCSPDDLLR